MGYEDTFYVNFVFLTPLFHALQPFSHDANKTFPINAPGMGLERLICLADVHSLMNLHSCVKFGPDRSSGLRQDRR